MDASLSASQASKGTPVTFTDSTATSPYTQSQWTRVITVYNADNTLIATLPLTGSNTTATLAVTKDQYLTATLTYTSGPVSVNPDTIDIGLNRFTNNKFNIILSKNRCNLSPNQATVLTKSFLYMYGANLALVYNGNAPQYDTYINAANSYLNTVYGI